MEEMRECVIPNCNRKIYAKHMCNRHYIRNFRYGDPLGGGYDRNYSNNYTLSLDGKRWIVSTSKNKFLISLEDRVLVEQCVWHINDNCYPRTNFEGKKIYLHSLLMGTPPTNGLVVDHKNRNKLDAQRSNLRWVTSSVNNMKEKLYGTGDA